jgi:hypothetical protein
MYILRKPEDQSRIVCFTSDIYFSTDPKPRAMDKGMTYGTQGNQILLGIIAALAAKFLVMNLKVHSAPAALASPAVAA